MDDPRLYSAPGCGDDLLKCSERPIGRFLVDIYQYPPAFLLLPALARTLTDDFYLVRRGWFVAQVGLFAVATLLLARWIGGTAGAITAMLSVVLWASPSMLLGIQIGNFQATAYALSVLGMIALAAVMFALVFDGIWMTAPPRWAVVVTLVNQVLALGLNGWVLACAIARTNEDRGARVRAAASFASVAVDPTSGRRSLP